MHKYEIEIKSLLGSKASADDLIAKMRQADPNLKILGSHKQLNHYFVGNDLKSLSDKVQELLDDSSRAKLKDLSERAKDFSVRTREADGQVKLVVKATVDDTTSENGTARLEWEHPINLGLDELDKLILSVEFACQAKWSRERQEFAYHPADGGTATSRPKSEVIVSIDKNAGYGYLAEFEMVIDDASKSDETKSFIRALMDELGAAELPQDRLERMFKFYNDHWRDYYGTDKTFTLE